MRSHKVVFALGLFLFVGIGLLLAGCSDDDTPTNPGPTPGIDSEYEVVAAEVDELVDMSLTLFGESLDVFAEARTHTDSSVGLDNFLLSSFDPDDLTVSDSWYIFINTDIQAAYGDTRIDSVRFTDNGAPLEVAVGADGMLIKHQIDRSYTDTGSDYTDFVVHSDFNFSGLHTADANITGDAAMNSTSQTVTTEGTVVRTFTITAEFVNVVIDDDAAGWATGIPASGTCNLTVGLVTQVGNAPERATNWTLQATFTDGAIETVISDGTYEETLNRTFQGIS